MELQTLHLALGPGAVEFLVDQLLTDPSNDTVWTFPDYKIRLYFDKDIPGTDARLDHAGTRQETRQLMTYGFPAGVLPADVTKLINLSYEEILRCYERGCHLAAVALCGRAVETALGGLYQKLKGIHPSNEPGWKPGIKKILEYLDSQGYHFPPGTNSKIEAIAQHRNMAIHGNLVVPTTDEARSVIFLTKDVLQIAAEPVTATTPE